MKTSFPALKLSAGRRVLAASLLAISALVFAGLIALEMAGCEFLYNPGEYPATSYGLIMIPLLAVPFMFWLASLLTQVGIVLSILLIAALFTPLRRRVQNLIDRRFYRRKYNAALVLGQFAETARVEVNLDALMVDLNRAVQETLQPQHVSFWFREDRL